MSNILTLDLVGYPRSSLPALSKTFTVTGIGEEAFMNRYKELRPLLIQTILDTFNDVTVKVSDAGS